jgi:hypothetical protein
MIRYVPALLLVCTALWGCSPTVTVKHKVAPIHITVDVNVRVQKELDEFFDFEEEIEQEKDETEESDG